MNIDRSKWIAIITGIFSLFIGILYLLMVQILDMRGEMIPAPLSLLGHLGFASCQGYSPWL